MPFHVGYGTLAEAPPALGRERGVREALRPRPAADGHEHPELGVARSEPGQHAQVFGVAREALHQAAVLDVGEGVVDVRQLRGVDLVRREQALLREDVADDRGLRRRARGGRGGGHGGEQDGEGGQHARIIA